MVEKNGKLSTCFCGLMVVIDSTKIFFFHIKLASFFSEKLPCMIFIQCITFSINLLLFLEVVKKPFENDRLGWLHPRFGVI